MYQSVCDVIEALKKRPNKKKKSQGIEYLMMMMGADESIESHLEEGSVCDVPIRRTRSVIFWYRDRSSVN